MDDEAIRALFEEMYADRIDDAVRAAVTPVNTQNAALATQLAEAQVALDAANDAAANATAAAVAATNAARVQNAAAVAK